jgi:hypothetical protein
VQSEKIFMGVAKKAATVALLIISLVILTTVPAHHAAAASDKKDEKAPAKDGAKAPAKAPVAPVVPVAPKKNKGDVVMESISQPILRGRKIVSYDHATIILWLRTRDHASIVCANRYKLADSFLLDLHDNPISARKKKDGRAEAEQRLFDLAVETFGPRVVKRLRIEWARSPTGGKTTIFGTFTDVQCDASS